MIELHVNGHDCLQKRANEKYGEFGGSVSVSTPQGANPTIVFGQYEADFNQFIFNGSMWIGTGREQVTLPKINGIVVMASYFQSRETGFGLEISDAMIKLINKRRAGKH